MSAFCDIALCNAIYYPKYNRLNETAWQQSGWYWESIGTKGGNYIHKYRNPDGELVIIGQLYEAIDTVEIFERVRKYVSKASNAFEDPAGHYAIFYFDSISKEYHVFTNRLGTYHVYYSSIDKVISTYYLGLAKQASTRKLDWQGVAGFFSNGFFPDDKTYLEGITILQPASWYCFDESLNLIHHKRYWDWQFEPQKATINEWCDALHYILRDSIATAVEDKATALPLSGGLDSRTIAGVLTKIDAQYTSLWAYSYGYSAASSEIKIGKQIANRRNIRFDSYVVPDYLWKEMANITESVELFQYLTGTRQAYVREAIQTNADVVIGGHWGDVWLDGMGTEEHGNYGQLFKKKIVKNGSVQLLSTICSHYMPDYKNYLDSYFDMHTSKYAHIKDADFRMKIYKTDQWSFRWTVPSLRMYQAAAMPVLPFYDKRIVDLFIKIPSEVLKGRELQIAYLKKYHPDLASIKWQEYDRNLYRYKGFNNRHIVYRSVNKLKRVLSGKPHISRNWEVCYLNENGKQNLHDSLNTPAIKSIVPADDLRKMLDDFYKNPNATNGYAISMLHTFAQFVNTVL